MIYAIVAEAIIILCLVALVALVAKGAMLERDRRAAAYERTLQSMADRIQAPSRLPLRDGSVDYVIPEREPDEWAQVGQINISDKYGLEED